MKRIQGCLSYAASLLFGAASFLGLNPVVQASNISIGTELHIYQYFDDWKPVSAVSAQHYTGAACVTMAPSCVTCCPGWPWGGTWLDADVSFWFDSIVSGALYGSARSSIVLGVPSVHRSNTLMASSSFFSGSHGDCCDEIDPGCGKGAQRVLSGAVGGQFAEYDVKAPVNLVTDVYIAIHIDGIAPSMVAGISSEKVFAFVVVSNGQDYAVCRVDATTAGSIVEHGVEGSGDFDSGGVFVYEGMAQIPLGVEASLLDLSLRARTVSEEELRDVDGSMIVDVCDLIVLRAAIAAGPVPASSQSYDIRMDLNFDGVVDQADEAPLTAELPAFPGDVNGDYTTNGADLSILIGNMNQTPATREQGDLNGDNVVDGSDLSILISNFGYGTPSFHPECF